MLYLLDTADVKAIAHFAEYYPLAGVTTNPTLVAKEKTDFFDLIQAIRLAIGSDRMLHIQTMQKTALAIVEEAEMLQRKVGGNFYIKIPIGEDGLKATAELKKRGINVTMTAIFTPQQALVSAMAGASFVAPYVNRLDNILADGVGVTSDIVTLLDNFGLDCKVLAASFKNTQQVMDCALSKCHAVTLPAEIFSMLIQHPLTDVAVNGFENDWKSYYGDKTILDL